jgi:Domain of unknown function (DUF4375)
MAHVNTPAEEQQLLDWFEATAGRAWESLSEAESAVWKAYQFDLAVQNGGFDKGLRDFGDRWPELLHSLERIGALKIAAMCKEAASVFPNGNAPIDSEQRNKECWALDQAAKDLLWRLGGDYYELRKTDSSEDVLSKMFWCLKCLKVL